MLSQSAQRVIKNGIDFENYTVLAVSDFQSPSIKYKQGLQDKVNELKCVELRLSAIDEELSKFYPTVEIDEQMESSLQTESYDHDILETSHEFLNQEGDVLDQEELDTNKEDAKHILDIINTTNIV